MTKAPVKGPLGGHQSSWVTSWAMPTTILGDLSTFVKKARKLSQRVLSLWFSAIFGGSLRCALCLPNSWDQLIDPHAICTARSRSYSDIPRGSGTGRLLAFFRRNRHRGGTGPSTGVQPYKVNRGRAHARSQALMHWTHLRR